MRQTAIFFLFLLLAVCLAVSCSDDDSSYPSVLTEMAVARTGQDSIITDFLLDSGERLTPSNNMRAPKGDTIYRIRCTYLPEEAGKAILYKAIMTVSKHPKDSGSYAGAIVRDPVRLTSSWIGGGYANLHVCIMTKGGEQELSFLHESTERLASGKKRITLSLCHDQKDDPEAYSKETFLSCPLAGLAPEEGDSIVFKVMTYDGDKACRLIYSSPKATF